MDDFGDRFALLVVDEAHHFATGAREEALEMCAATWRLGLSATPPRQTDELSRLERVVGPVVCVTSIQELTGTSLAPLERVVLPVDLSAEERTRYDACYLPFAEAARGYFRSASGGNWADFTRALAAGPAGVQLLAGYHEAVRIVGLAEAKLERVRSLLTRHRGSRSLVFTAGNDEAYALSRELLVPAITCAISAAERAEYGRALASWLPALIRAPGWSLVASLTWRGEAVRLELDGRAPLSTTGPLPRRFDSQVEERLLRDLQKLRTAWIVRREADPVQFGGRILCPDFTLIDDGRRLRVAVEVVGYWTPEYLAAKVAAVAALPPSRRWLLCVDESLAAAAPELPQLAPVLYYRRRVPAARLLELVEELFRRGVLPSSMG
jgi:hypothetical protein